MGSKTKNLSLDTTIYPLEAILNASFLFLDRFYIFLKRGKHKHILKVSLTLKRTLPKKKYIGLSNEFFNAILQSSLRYFVSKRNKKIRDYIVNRALYSALPLSDSFDSQGEGLDYRKDPLGIAVPWEEKYGKQKKNMQSRV